MGVPVNPFCPIGRTDLSQVENRAALQNARNLDLIDFVGEGAPWREIKQNDPKRGTLSRSL